MYRKQDERYFKAPVTSIRLPLWQITALQMIANREHVTVTDIIRDCVEKRLKDDGFGYVQEVIDGQMTIRDFE